jgi:uncharacterized membrane protein
MSDPQPPAPKLRCAPCLALLLLGVVVLLVASTRIALVTQKVFSGAGMEHCCSIEGVPFNYLGVFVMLCGLAAGFLVAAALYVRDWLLRREFERKYGVKVPASIGERARSGGSDGGPSLHGVDAHDV